MTVAGWRQGSNLRLPPWKPLKTLTRVDAPAVGTNIELTTAFKVLASVFSPVQAGAG